MPLYSIGALNSGARAVYIQSGSLVLFLASARDLAMREHGSMAKEFKGVNV